MRPGFEVGDETLGIFLNSFEIFEESGEGMGNYNKWIWNWKNYSDKMSLFVVDLAVLVRMFIMMRGVVGSQGLQEFQRLSAATPTPPQHLGSANRT